MPDIDARQSTGGGPRSSDLRFSIPDITAAEVEAATRALTSGWITTGNESVQLEAELAEYLGVPHVVAVSSCTAALEIAYAFLDLPRGARVGVPTWTFVSSALAAYHRGARPVLLDIDPATFNLSVDSLARALDEGLDAVIGVHFGGTPLPAEVHDLCRSAGVPLIEDAAHALGARDFRGMTAGQGTAGCCFSFYATKNLTSAEGGALATDDPELARFAESFRLHGLSRDAWARYLPGSERSEYDILGDGLKANLPDVLAAVARAQLERFGQIQGHRRLLVERYRSQLASIDGLEVVPTEPDPNGADHLMMVLLPEATDRSQVEQTLREAGIGTSVHFKPLHRFHWFERQGIGAGPGGVEQAEAAAGRALSLPLHSVLDPADVDQICDVLAGALGR